MIAGLEEITGGTVRVGGEVVNDLPPKARDMAMIFQNYALYPHMNVYDNMGFGLKMRGDRQGEIRRRVEAAARILGLTRGADEAAAPPLRRPAAARRDGPCDRPRAAGLPHGRAALESRREAARPDAGRDRPDPARPRRDDDLRHARPERGDDARRPRLRDARRASSSRSTGRRFSTTAPANLFVAGFIGSPAMNLVEAELVERGGGLVVRFGPHELPVPAAGSRRAAAVAARHPPRGHHAPPGEGAPLDVTVDIKEDMGAEVYLHFAVDAPPVTAAELVEIVGEEALEAADEQTHHHGSTVHRPRRAGRCRARGSADAPPRRHVAAALLRRRHRRVAHRGARARADALTGA